MYMLKRIVNGIEYYQFHHLEAFSSDLGHAVLTKKGGFSEGKFGTLNLCFERGDLEENVEKNRYKLLKSFGLEVVMSGFQPHRDEILILKDERLKKLGFGEKSLHNELHGFDGMVTNLVGVGLLVKVADCQALVLYDPAKKVIGCVHAGWRGQKAGIVKKVVKIMVENFGCIASRILVGVSPSLSFAAAEFTDPLLELGEKFERFISGKKVDLVGFTQRELIEAGISESKIELSRICTVNDKRKRFFSHRLGDAGRSGVMIWLK